MQELSFGNLYDANKQLSHAEPLMTEPEKAGRWQKLIEYLFGRSDNYYMLLCHERRDYTVFAVRDSKDIAAHKFPVELFDCLRNRGGLVSMDPVDNGYAWEIWLRIDDEDFCYMLFPYDNGVIEI